MTSQRWCIALSPDGAARAVSAGIAAACTREIGGCCKTFDTLAYRQFFTRLLARPNDNQITDLLNQSLCIACLDFRATHLLVTALAPVTLFTLNLLRSYGVITIHWFFEDFRRAPYWIDVAEGYDHFCAIQRTAVEEYCRKKGIVYHFLPTACGITDSGETGSLRPYDIAFIGIPSPYRITCLEKCAAMGYTLAIGGSGWKSYRGPLEKNIISGEWITADDSFQLLRKAKIVINLSVDEPKEREHVHCSPRLYEALAAGCLLVTEAVPLLAESLSGCTCRTFHTMDEACATIGALLGNYPSYAEETRRNREVVLQEHTYQKRFGQLSVLAEKRGTAGTAYSSS